MPYKKEAAVRGVGMGDFFGGEDTSPVAGRCRACGKPVTAGATYCIRHKHLLERARGQSRRLRELARRRRARRLIHEWWEATK
jgi:hypothetical protein